SVTFGHNSIDQTAESLDHSLLAFGYELLVNIVRLTRFIKPAARALGLPWVNWRSLRTSHATWLKMAGADVKDAQAQMRHARSSTTLGFPDRTLWNTRSSGPSDFTTLYLRIALPAFTWT